MASEQRLGTAVIVLNPEKTHVLLGKRINGYKAGTYGAPGGRLELDELVEECAKRETLEETGITATEVTYIGIIRERREQEANFIHFVYLCNEFEGTPTCAEPDKCAGWDWHPLEKLPTPMLPGHAAAVALYKASIKGKYSPLVDLFTPKE